MYNFFKKFQTWSLSQMTPVSTFFERPDLSREDPSTLKVNFLVKIAIFSRNCVFFALFKPPTPSTENASNPKVNFLVK